MRATNAFYDLGSSVSRIDDILDSVDASYVEVKSIPDADQLTLSNGFNIKCTALFIDIRGSSNLPQSHTRPVLAKLYRAYVSECVAVLNASLKAVELFIQGDSVSAIFDTPHQSDIDHVFETAAKLNSLINILNWKLEKKRYTSIQCGIGMAWGAALMVKAGFTGSGINEIVWMGNVVNEAAHLCHQGSRGTRSVIQVSKKVYAYLAPAYQKMLSPVQLNFLGSVDNYEGNIVHEGMHRWLENERFKVRRISLLDQVFETVFGSPEPPSPELLASNRLLPCVSPSGFL